MSHFAAVTTLRTISAASISNLNPAALQSHSPEGVSCSCMCSSLREQEAWWHQNLWLCHQSQLMRLRLEKL